MKSALKQIHRRAILKGNFGLAYVIWNLLTKGQSEIPIGVNLLSFDLFIALNPSNEIEIKNDRYIWRNYDNFN